MKVTIRVEYVKSRMETPDSTRSVADRKIYQKEQAIRKKISKVENDISLWRNNLEFFGHSSNPDKVRNELNEKFQGATIQLSRQRTAEDDQVSLSLRSLCSVAAFVFPPDTTFSAVVILPNHPCSRPFPLARRSRVNVVLT